MNEYKEHLDRYKNYWLSSRSVYITEEEWGDRELAESYLQKYWLPIAEYESSWRRIQEQVFLPDVLYPEMVFRSDFQMLPIIGGCLYSRELFEQQRSALDLMNEHWFVIVQVGFGCDLGDPLFRMKYPSSTAWEEMMSGNYISSVIAEREFDQYFVFGSRGDWGMLVNGGINDPANILVFRPELSGIFRGCYPNEDDLPLEYVNELPSCYRSLRS